MIDKLSCKWTLNLFNGNDNCTNALQWSIAGASTRKEKKKKYDNALYGSHAVVQKFINRFHLEFP